MSRLKRINIGYFKSRVRSRKKASRGELLREARAVVENQEEMLRLELETLYMIGAPAS